MKEVDWGEDKKKALEHIREYLNTITEFSVPEQREELYAYLGQSESAIRGLKLAKTIGAEVLNIKCKLPTGRASICRDLGGKRTHLKKILRRSKKVVCKI